MALYNNVPIIILLFLSAKCIFYFMSLYVYIVCVFKLVSLITSISPSLCISGSTCCLSYIKLFISIFIYLLL